MTAATPHRPRSKGPIYIIRLRGGRSRDDIRSLGQILKVLLLRHRIVCISVNEEGARHE